MKRVFIPRTIHLPPLILLWTLEEVLVMAGAVGFGIVMEQLMACLVIGYFSMKKYKKFQDDHPDGYLEHLLYWHFNIGGGKRQTIPNCYVKEWIQ